MVKEFQGEYRFLSNFWPCQIRYEGRTYPSTEHAFQAAKTVKEEEKTLIQKAKSAGEAKKLGRYVTLRKDWGSRQLAIMEEVNWIKFTSDPYLRECLLLTGDEELQEGNSWGDIFWGVSGGRGQNHLGKILMHVRARLKHETNPGSELEL